MSPPVFMPALLEAPDKKESRVFEACAAIAGPELIGVSQENSKCFATSG